MNDSTKQAVMAERDVPAESVTPSQAAPLPALHTSERPALVRDRRSSDRRANELLEHLGRIEDLLGQIRGELDATARDRQHKDFSATRLLGTCVQALVVALLAWALSDWIFQISGEALLIKLAFAAVLQLVALTALTVARREE
ncbi:MAG: hypothetical protein KKB50_11915 [Planctomycetes bacterium]|nr:hypothetical protein [Planctomycetota bacterium]